MKNYYDNGITEKELSFMKNAIGQSDALRYETPGQKALFIRRILDHNLPSNYPQAQHKLLMDMTKNELDKTTKKYLALNKMNILLVGDKAKYIR